MIPLIVRGTYSETNWQAYVSVKEYKSYSSVRLLEYHVPENTYDSNWYFTSYHSPDSCEERTILIYLQHGSFPVISPLNESFPDNFYLTRTEPHLVMASSNRITIHHDIMAPLPGSWYAAVILGDYVDESISVKGIGDDCYYYLGCTHHVQVLDSVDNIPIGVSIQLTVSSNTSVLYRFHTYEHTWQYQLKISNCSSANSENTSICPLVLSSRAFSLPTWSTEDSHIVNCFSEATDYCQSTVNSPATNSWNYIQLMAIGDENIEFTLFIETTECIKYSYVTKMPTDSTQGDSDGMLLFSPTYQTTGMHSTNNLKSNWSKSSTDDFLALEADSDGSVVFRNVAERLSEIWIRNETKPSPREASGPSHAIYKQRMTPKENDCIRLPELGRYILPSSPFYVRYYQRLNEENIPNEVFVVDNEPVVFRFEVRSLFDTGGTLKFDVWLDEAFQNTTQEVELQACIQRHSIPVDGDNIYCDPDRLLHFNTSQDGSSSYLYFPYPEPGSWYMAFQTKCYNNQSFIQEECLQRKSLAVFDVIILPCVDGGCGEYGSCRQYYTGVLHYSSCSCSADWRGYGCTDDTEAMPDWEQLLSVLLLTLSNLFFMPAILVACYRCFFTEALVYFFTMFFSTFYHACDGDLKYTYCIMPYDVLSFCDFFGAILSFWVTIITMAKLVHRLHAFLFMLGALGIAMGVTWDQFSVWTFLVPIVVALAILALSWGWRCCQSRACYPSLKRYAFYLVPGLLLAGAGLIVYTFFETESNYHYTHSFWHATIQLSIVFLLPPRQPKKSAEIHKYDLEYTPMEDDGNTCNSIVLTDIGVENPGCDSELSNGNTVVYPL